MKILQEENYQKQMEQVVEPCLAARACDRMLEREPGHGIHCMLYRADMARGCVVISHGFTESGQKYHEVAYGFLRQGYHVILPEHCGHGRSYRLLENRSLVHVDSWHRYVDDLLFVTRQAVQELCGGDAESRRQTFSQGDAESRRQTFAQGDTESPRQISTQGGAEAWQQTSHQGSKDLLPVYLYAHSMGGGIGAAAAAQAPELFQKVVLTSPMIRPATGNVPWGISCALTQLACLAGKAQDYGPGQKPYDGQESFSESCSLSESRFRYYQEKRKADPNLQTNGCSWGWLREAMALNRYLQKQAWKSLTMPLRLYQAGDDQLVSKSEQERFIRKISIRTGNADAKLILVKGSRHEIFNAQADVQNLYWKKIYRFLED